eukprot:TRINITY_DN139677_c0_g1_i1.p2 TRINITY_DN139677_c0_g1~~TRINITY_DN139677_c0_g1_i1.p2  ORF type:complete len:299 (+),score=17.56 TRINITY_DN139677_c0_g1_i1:984-1880(+)
MKKNRLQEIQKRHAKFAENISGIKIDGLYRSYVIIDEGIPITTQYCLIDNALMFWRGNILESVCPVATKYFRWCAYENEKLDSTLNKYATLLREISVPTIKGILLENITKCYLKQLVRDKKPFKIWPEGVVDGQEWRNLNTFRDDLEKRTDELSCTYYKNIFSTCIKSGAIIFPISKSFPGIDFMLTWYDTLSNTYYLYGFQITVNILNHDASCYTTFIHPEKTHPPIVTAFKKYFEEDKSREAKIEIRFVWMGSKKCDKREVKEKKVDPYNDSMCVFMDADPQFAQLGCDGAFVQRS